MLLELQMPPLQHCGENRSDPVENLLGRETLWSSPCSVYVVCGIFLRSFLDEGLRLGESGCVMTDYTFGVFCFNISDL